MDQDEFVIFAELDRGKFEDILERLMKQFHGVQFGRQGDDWIWVHVKDDRIEIDTFYSEHLEVKGRRKQFSMVQQMLKMFEKVWILNRFDPPKVDLTR